MESVDQRKKCDLCEKTFSVMASLKNHLKYAHSESRDHNCGECDAKFKQNKDLNVHYLNNHNNNRSKETYGIDDPERLQCEQCDSTFKYKKGLNAHIKLKHDKNNSGNSYDCDECCSKFNAKKNLNAHKRVKHGNAQEYPCPTCGKVFNQKSNRTKHQKMHDF